MVHNARATKSDDFYTPYYVTYALLKYIPRKLHRIWEPAAGEGHIIGAIEANTPKTVIATDITEGSDFLTQDNDEVRLKSDCIITNPPFSLSTQFIKKCVEIDIPFALLIPITHLQGGKRTQRTKTISTVKDLSILIFTKRIKFIGGGTQPNFGCMWLCSGFGLDKQIYFLED